jgi:tight adherence protein C
MYSSVLIFGAVFATILMFVFGLKTIKDDKKKEEPTLHPIAQADVSPGKLLRKKALENSFQERVLFPIAQQVFDRTQQFIPLSSKSWVTNKLIQAGYQKSHHPKIFLGIQLISTVLIFAGLFLFTMLFGKVPGLIGFLVSAFFGAFGYFLPMVWLNQEAKKRQDSIQKSLPDFLDLLVICVEAGLGLDVAINKISNLQAGKSNDILREELMRYIKDVAFGKSRKQALLDMSTRTGVEDFTTIINALVQAYEMGSSVAQTLRVQADSLRVKRLQKAEEKANKIPVKMVMPIYIFLFPAIFVAIFGPMGMVLIKTAMTIFDNVNLGQ